MSDVDMNAIALAYLDGIADAVAIMRRYGALATPSSPETGLGATGEGSGVSLDPAPGYEPVAAIPTTLPYPHPIGSVDCRVVGCREHVRAQAEACQPEKAVERDGR